MLGYVDFRDAMETHVNKKDIFYLKDIVKNYKTLYKNVRGHTKFLNEAGMYSLILKSHKKEAKEIFDWLTHEVMPSIRKYGEYKLNHTLKEQIDKLNKVIVEQGNEIGVLEHNLKKPKFAKGGIVYIMRTINDTVKFDVNQILYLKFGSTKDMNKRKSTYDTCTQNQIQIIKSVPVNDSKNIERCVINKMNEFIVKNRKEYFKCSYNKLIDEIASCVKFYENTDIDMKPDISQLNRSDIGEFNKDAEMIIKILSDDEFDELCCIASDQSDESDSSDHQYGGCDDAYQNYLTYKLKYLKLKYELL
jgi:hypothetical protein